MKKAYSTPKLTVHGQVEEITKGREFLGQNSDGRCWWWWGTNPPPPSTGSG